MEIKAGGAPRGFRRGVVFAAGLPDCNREVCGGGFSAGIGIQAVGTHAALDAGGIRRGAVGLAGCTGFYEI